MFEGAAVVGPVAAHGHCLARVLIHHDYLGLVVRLGPREDRGAVQELLFEVRNVLDFAVEQVVEGIASDAQLRILLFGLLNDSGHVLLVGVLTVREGRLADFAQR